MSTIEQPPQYNPYHLGGPQPPQPTNGLATGGFVTALVGALVALIPVVGIVSWLVCPVGLVLSIVGLSTAAKKGGVGRGLAIAGVALAIGGLIICSMYAAAFTSAMSQASRTPSASAPSSSVPAYSAPSYSAPSYSAPSYSAPSYSASAVPVAPAAPAGPLTSIPSGTYEIGTGDGQVAPGKYVAAPGSAMCYYARLSSTDGDFGSIIDNKAESGGGQVLLTVKSSDKALEVSGDCTFTKR